MIFITGGSGFVGKNLITRLKQNKTKYTAPDRDKLNLDNINDLSQQLCQIKPRYIIHLAANVGGIKYIADNPACVYYDNTILNTNILEAARIANVKRIINLSTINIYSNELKPPYKEQHCFRGQPESCVSSYGISKRNFQYQSCFYNEQHGINTINLISDNIYGTGDNYNINKARVIPANIVRLLDAKNKGKNKIDCWGTGKSTRSFIHVEDVVDAIIHFLNLGDTHDNINLGTGEKITIKNLIKIIAEALDYNVEINWDNTMPEGSLDKYMDCKKIQEIYHFMPKFNIKTGIIQTVQTYIKEKKISNVEKLDNNKI